MHCLPVLDQDRLRIGETLAIDRIVIARHADKFAVFDISVNGLLGLDGPWTRVDDECPVEPVGFLGHIIVVAVIPVASHVLIADREVIDMGLAWLKWILSKPGHPIFAFWNLQAMPV